MRNIYRCRVCGRYVEEEYHCGVKTELFLDAKRRVLLSKLMSGLLRHYPWEAGLRISSDGWVSIDELVHGIREKWRNRILYQWVTREHVIAVALLDPKERFEVRNGYIRARYGHSIPVTINYPAVDNPPGKLYHGTSTKSLPGILQEGIKPMKRKYVHLTIDPGDALETGRRHGIPVLLVVDTDCLIGKGYMVYRATSKIYLVEHVPPECIKVASKG